MDLEEMCLLDTETTFNQAALDLASYVSLMLIIATKYL